MSNAKRQRHIDKILRRDAHAKLVANRSSDPNYVQRTRTESGYRLEMTPSSAEALVRQKALFVVQFGREPGPTDPVFFDPSKSEPAPLTEAALPQMVSEMVHACVAAGIDPAYGYAFGEVGYLVTEENRHLFSAHEVEAFSEAVSRHQQ